MYQMIFFVLDDIDHYPAILDAWEEAGVGGITIFESTGLGRMRKVMGMRDDFPLLPSLVDFLQGREERHRTLVTVADSDELIERVVAATEAIVGDLSLPNRGILLVLPVTRVYGLAQRP